MKMSVLVGFVCCLGAIGVVPSSWAAQEEKQKASDRNKIRLLVAGSLTAEPVAHAVTYDAIYGAQFGVGIQDSDSNSAFVSACVAQFPSKRNQIVKTFAGLPFVVESFTPDKDVELPDPIRITLVGGVKKMAWKDTKSSRQPGKNHIDGQEGGVRLNGMWLLAAGTSVMDWGVLRQNRGQNIAIPERYLNKPRVWATLAKSSLIIPSAGSEVPCLCDKEGFPSRIVPNAIGVIWVFEKAGTEIVIGRESYRAEKDAATIQFTAAGPVMKDVVRKEDESTQLPTQDQKDVTPDEVSSHRVLYQEGVDATIVKDGKRITERIAVYGVAGLRFPAGNLAVDQRAKLATTVITIEAANGEFLVPERNSAVPVNMGFDETVKFGLSFFTHTINTTWKFSKPGIRFKAGDGTYESERSDASISFTENGVKIDGLKKIAGN
jgi:hypothetical protein